MLMDYELACGIVWGAVRRIQQDLRPVRRRKWASFGVIAVLAVLALLEHYFKLLRNSVDIVQAFTVIGALFGLTLLLHLLDMIRVVTRTKAEIINDIRQGDIRELCDLALLDRVDPQVAWTNGIVSADRTLVCYARQPRDLLSGLGLQGATKNFCCPPVADRQSELMGTDAAFAAARASLERATAAWEAEDTVIRIGDVIVVEPSSAKVRAPWIDDDGRPRLRIRLPEDVSDAQLRAVGGTRYIAVQLLFCRAGAAATVLMRPTISAGSAVLEVTTLTMGPPRRDSDWIEDRFVDLQPDSVRRTLLRYLIKYLTGLDVYPRLLCRLERLVLRCSRLGPRSPLPSLRWDIAVHSPPRLGLFGLAPGLESLERREQLWAKRLTAPRLRWLGRRSGIFNYRASNSVAFVYDSGAPRTTMVLETVRDGAARAILGVFRDRGYDLSRYCNERGVFVDTACNIAHLSGISETRGGRPQRRRYLSRSITTQEGATHVHR
jgi:hypothetical protein